MFIPHAALRTTERFLMEGQKGNCRSARAVSCTLRTYQHFDFSVIKPACSQPPVQAAVIASNASSAYF